MQRSLRMAAQIVVAGFIASLLVWAQPAVAVTAPRTLAHRVPVQVGPVEPGFPVGYVGVMWETDHVGHDRTESHGAVRFRHGTRWGPWVTLIDDGIQAPGRWASGLVDGAGADGYQVRGIPADARGARTVAINTTDGPLVEVGTRPGGAAHAVDSTMCRSRADWGADESLRLAADGSEVWSPAFHGAQVMTVHHTATQNADPDPAATVRAIYRYHAVDQGWGDIGYQYLVDASGVVYEGRWSGTASPSCAAPHHGDGSSFAHEEGTDRMVTGAHTGGWNSGNLGVSLLGEFTDHRQSGGEPAPAAVEALEDLLAELSLRHGLDPLATVDYVNPVNAEVKTVDAIGGHRDYAATECPGQRLYDLLPTIRQDVKAKMGTSVDSPPTVAVTTPGHGEVVSGSVGITAVASDDVGVTQVSFSVDGTPAGTGTESDGGWTGWWDTTTVGDGPHTVTATATDTGGRTASHSVVVEVDNAADTTVVHVVDLDGAAQSAKKQWRATARITVANLDGTAATVKGTWTTTGTEVSCTTDGGSCSVTSPPVSRSTGSLTFRVTAVGHPSYDPTQNVDPDGDSDGTTITVAK